MKWKLQTDSQQTLPKILENYKLSGTTAILFASPYVRRELGLREPIIASLPRREVREAQTERPQTPARGGVIGLGVGSIGLFPIEIDTRLPFEAWRSGDMEDGVSSLLNAAQRFDAALDDHLGVHESRRVQTIGRDARPFERFGEVEGEHHQRELALTVGAKTVVAAREHHVGEIDPLLPGRGHVDDPGGRVLADQRQEQMGEQKGREIIYGEAQFMAFAARFAFHLAASGGPYAGLVDQNLQPVVFRLDRLGQPSYLIKRGEIGSVIFEPVIARLITDRAKDILALLLIASVQQNSCARNREPQGHEFANAVSRTRDQHGLVSDIHILIPIVAENDGGESSLRLSVPCCSAQDVDLPLFSELSKRRAKPRVNSSDRRPPDVGQDQPSHASSPRLSRDVERGGMTSNSASEMDRTVPTGCFGEHQVSPRRPSWELEKLRRPNDPSASGLDQISESVMRRMDDAAPRDRQAAGRIGLHRRFKSHGASESANLSHQFTALIRHEPGVNLAFRRRTRPAVEHHPTPAMFYK